jgi:hypothetical protein
MNVEQIYVDVTGVPRAIADCRLPIADLKTSGFVADAAIEGEIGNRQSAIGNLRGADHGESLKRRSLRSKKSL